MNALRFTPHASRVTPATAALLAFLAVFFGLFLFYPLGYMFKAAFWPAGGFTLEFFRLFFNSPFQLECLRNSFALGIIVTALTTVITLPVAHWFSRYSFPGKTLLSGLLLVPMIMPPFVGAIGVKQVFARFGSLNLLLDKLGLVPVENGIDWLGAGGFWGVVILGVLHVYPIMFLNVTAAMANVDPTLREAAENLGARGWRLFRTITLPLVMPGYFAGAIIVFIFAFTDLGTPLLIGYNRVVAVQIFDKVVEVGTNPFAYTLVILVLLLTVVLFLVSKWITGEKSYQMMARGHTAGAETPAPPRLRWMIYCGTIGLILVSLLPHASVVVQSFASHWFMSILPDQMTTQFYGEVFRHPLTLSSIRNSLFFSSLSAFLDLVLGVMIAWLLTRRRVPGANLLDAIAMLPLALPGIVLAFGYVAGFNIPVNPKSLPPAWYQWLHDFMDPSANPTFLLIISYSVRRLPYIVRAAVAGLQQTSVTLEEASLNLGASPLRTMRKITLPLVMANLIAGTILTFSFAMLEVSDSLILAMKEAYFPITKGIYQLIGRVDPNAPAVACALGVLGMVLLAASLLIASKALGKKMGQLFRA
ncbi:MAG: iron ABC transporter permease [Verrucomicrobia bacterium]|nr:iron ABC transporter permease [Verrucomicrobiota bacterium]